MASYVLLAVLIALLVGVATGKAWERYKLRDGRWIDRRRLRETPHYMLGLNFLVDQHVDQAIDELTQASAGDVMTKNPVTIRRETLAAEALLVLERRKITSIVVVDDGQRVQGVVHLHHLWRTEMF